MASATQTPEAPAGSPPLIQTNYCEVSVAHHCNLSCRGCSHLSPVWSKEFVDPAVLGADLRVMAKFYRSENLRLLGGEPLLHPDFLAVVAAVRASGITNHISVGTNGLLLWKMPDAFWEAVDHVDVSVYPGREMTPKQVRACQQKAKKHGTHLFMTVRNEFRESYSETGTKDFKMIKRIYNTCLIVHRLHCHNIEAGYFFKCPQAVFLPRMLEGKFPSPNVDGIKIADSPAFGEELRAYLDSPDPLMSCRNCLGSVGKRFEHSQVKRSEWRQLQQDKLEDLVDTDLLATLEDDLDSKAGSGPEWSDSTYYIQSRKQLLKYVDKRYGRRAAVRLLFDLVRQPS